MGKSKNSEDDVGKLLNKVILQTTSQLDAILNYLFSNNKWSWSIDIYVKSQGVSDINCAMEFISKQMISNEKEFIEQTIPDKFNIASTKEWTK